MVEIPFIAVAFYQSKLKSKKGSDRTNERIYINGKKKQSKNDKRSKLSIIYEMSAVYFLNPIFTNREKFIINLCHFRKWMQYTQTIRSIHIRAFGVVWGKMVKKYPYHSIELFTFVFIASNKEIFPKPFPISLPLFLYLGHDDLCSLQKCSLCVSNLFKCPIILISNSRIRYSYWEPNKMTTNEICSTFDTTTIIRPTGWWMVKSTFAFRNKIRNQTWFYDLFIIRTAVVHSQGDHCIGDGWWLMLEKSYGCVFRQTDHCPLIDWRDNCVFAISEHWNVAISFIFIIEIIGLNRNCNELMFRNWESSSFSIFKGNFLSHQ